LRERPPLTCMDSASSINTDIDTRTARSWNELVDILYEGSWDHSIERFRSPFVVRGACDSRSDLSTSLMRLGRGHEDLARLEGHLLRNFRKYAHMETAVGPSVWNWLAIAQHHGLHTRLLDWTYSPFVAMHFVTENLSWYDSDGVIWCINHRETNRLIPDVLKQAAEQSGSDVFTAEMLDEAAPTLESFDKLAPDPFVILLEPPSVDARIANQFALFSAMSSASAALHEWLGGHRHLGRRVIVPASLKWEVRDKLDQAGITERMLYPGLDGLTRWLSRYYTSRSAAGQDGRACDSDADPRDPNPAHRLRRQR
jgi:hypothetical protein